MGAPIGNQYAKGNRGGRPSKYNDSVLETTWDYVNGGWEKDSVIPTIEELAELIGVSRATLTDWETHDDKQEFSCAMSKLRNVQAKMTINKSLKGEWRNNLIIGRLLTTHGYKEKIETDNKNKIEAEAGASQDLLDRVAQIKRNIEESVKRDAVKEGAE